MLIYFAGPLFSEAERSFNFRLTEKLESAGFGVFLPQRDGAECEKAPYNRMGRDQRRLAMFELDKDKVFECGVFLFVSTAGCPTRGRA